MSETHPLTPIHRALGEAAGPLTYQLIERAVQYGVKETSDLDWKRETYPNGPKWPHEAVKDMAAMANSGGGWIVFGVADKDDRADSITGVGWKASEEQRLRQVAVNHIFPDLLNLEFEELTSPDGALTVVVLHVPAHSGPLHHLGKDRTYRVPFRNGAHVEFHGPLEVGRALLEFAGATPPPITPSDPRTHLKTLLLDPTKSVQVRDLVMGEVATVTDLIASQPVSVPGLDDAAYEEVLTGYQEALTPLVELVLTGIWNDQQGLHDSLWRDVLQSLIQAGTKDVEGAFQKPLRRARLYPALLFLYTVSVVCVLRGREQLLIDLSTKTKGVRYDVEERFAGCQILHPHYVLDYYDVRALPRWGGTQWTYPHSHLIKADVRPYFPDLSDDEFAEAFHGAEYRIGLLQEHEMRVRQHYNAMPGEFVGESGWTYENPPKPKAELRFRDDERHADEWPWVDLLGGHQEYERALHEYRSLLENYQYHRM